jgi:tetratricopeptide (TPR) repeat protein
MRIRHICSGYRFIALVVIFFLFIPFSKSFAGAITSPDRNPSVTITADKQLNYAEDLFSNKDYSTAVMEYKRFIYFFPEDQRVERAMYQTGMSYFLGGDFKAAVDSFKKLVDEYKDTDDAIKSYFKISEAYMKLAAVDLAIINLNNLIMVARDPDVRDAAYYRLGWIYLETASWEKGRQHFSKISVKNKEKFRLETLAAELEKEKLIPKKNPRLAGFLSVIPGAGYLYCERYQDALIAFLINGALIYAAYESFDEGNPALGGLLTFVEVGFYAGNIYGAVTSAHKYNRKKNGLFLERLKDNVKINLSADVKNNGVCLSFKLDF